MLSNTAFLLHYRKRTVKYGIGLYSIWNINVPNAYLFLKLIGYASKRPSTYQDGCFLGSNDASDLGLLLLNPGFTRFLTTS